MLNEIKNVIISHTCSERQRGSLAKQSIIILFVAAFFSACTDYVAQMEDDFEDWKKLQAEMYGDEMPPSSTSEWTEYPELLSSAVEDDGPSTEVKPSSSSKKLSSSSVKAKSSSSKKVSSSSVKASSSSKKVSSSSVKASSSSKTVSSSSVMASSSSKTVSSSSVVKSSSSVTNSSNVVYQDDFEDPRDGKSYRTVKIGEQLWMVDNLNYKTDDSYCLDDDLFNCNKYGRLYTWNEAIEVCPDGWRLPLRTDFEALVATAGGPSVAARKLKATFGWDEDNGTDEFGFMALPSGLRFADGSYYDLTGKNGEAYFWSSIEFDGNSAYDMQMSKNVNNVIINLFSDKEMGLSVRCIKGEKMVRASMKDPRDGQVYKTVTLGSQTWMAQNLNYMTDEVYGYYASDISDYRGDNGLLYPWDMVQDVCPSGWHLPSLDEWNVLYKFVLNDVGGDTTLVGAKLKAKYGWSGSIDGTDDYGFSARGAGVFLDEMIYDIRLGAYFWSSTLNDRGHGSIVYMRDEFRSMYVAETVNEEAFLTGVSVRCLKD